MRRVLSWVLPVVILVVAVAVLDTVSGIFGNVDSQFSIGALGSVQFVLNTNASALTTAMAVLIALVLLTVQLTAQRYSFSVLTIFVHDRVNKLTIGLFLVTIVYNLWLGLVLTEEYLPIIGILVAMALMTLCFAVLPPYILYLFDIIRPDAILDHIQKEFLRAIKASRAASAGRLEQQRTVAARSVSQMGDIAMTAIELSDAAVARHSVWTLFWSVERYLNDKGGLPTRWFGVDAHAYRGRHEFVVREVEVTKTWVEVQVLDELREIFFATLNKQHDVNNTVALVLRMLGERAAACGDAGVSEAVVRCFNTFLRATINQGDVRAGYHALYQYRLLASTVMDSYPDLAVQIAHRISYYGDAAGSGPLLWMSAAAAYDLRILAEEAHERAAALPAPGAEAVVSAIVGDLLDTVRRGEAKRSPALPQLYKMTLALAAFFTHHRAPLQVLALGGALAGLPPDFLIQLGAELRAVDVPTFWELTDRVVNFDYVEAPVRAKIPEVLAQFRTSTPEAVAITPGAGELTVS